MSGRVPGHPGRQVIAPRRTGLAVLRFAAANNMLNLEYATARGPLPPAPSVHCGGAAVANGRDALPRASPAAADRAQGTDPLRTVRLDRPRQQDPLPRGDRRGRPEDRGRPGMHDLGVSAGQHRPAMRDRRPSHVHRLRPQRRRSRAADPQAGHLQARRRRRLERLDRLRRPDPPRRHRRRQRDHRRQLRRHPGHPRQRGRRRRRRPASSACAPSRSACAGPTRSSPRATARPDHARHASPARRPPRLGVAAGRFGGPGILAPGTLGVAVGIDLVGALAMCVRGRTLLPGGLRPLLGLGGLAASLGGLLVGGGGLLVGGDAARRRLLTMLGGDVAAIVSAPARGPCCGR